MFDIFFSSNDILDEIEKPYFKEEYNGKPTKRYQKMIKLAEAIERISPADLFKV